MHGVFQAGILGQVAISSSGGLPDPGTKPISLVSPALAGRFFTTEPPGKPSDVDKIIHKVYKLPLLFVELIPRSSDSQRSVERSYCLKTSEIQKKTNDRGRQPLLMAR